MSESQTFWLRTPLARENACKAVSAAPIGVSLMVEICEETRDEIQNRHAHAALTDIAQQVTWHGLKFNVLTWKRLTMASFLREVGQQPELIPALDGNGFDLIFEKSSKLGKKKFSAWLDWIYSFGAEHGVKFRDNRHEAA